MRLRQLPDIDSRIRAHPTGDRLDRTVPNDQFNSVWNFPSTQMDVRSQRLKPVAFVF
jgi:hypothetical protein